MLSQGQRQLTFVCNDIVWLDDIVTFRVIPCHGAIGRGDIVDWRWFREWLMLHLDRLQHGQLVAGVDLGTTHYCCFWLWLLRAARIRLFVDFPLLRAALHAACPVDTASVCQAF